MCGESLSLQRADEQTIGYVTELLKRNDLPASDVTATPGRFYIGHDGDERVGVGGIERHDTDGLLRSVVIEQSARGRGFGSALCGALERTAQAKGVETLYLLTTTASDFFEDLEYVEIERTAVPASVQRTAEFSELCPATATCMTKSLR